MTIVQNLFLFCTKKMMEIVFKNEIKIILNLVLFVKITIILCFVKQYLFYIKL